MNKIALLLALLLVFPSISFAQKQESKIQKISSHKKNKVAKTTKKTRVAPKKGRGAEQKEQSIAETPPIVKVTPQGEGKFLIEYNKKEQEGDSMKDETPSQKDGAASPKSSEETERPKNIVLGFADLVIEKSKEFLGAPYRYGGSGTKGFDCSGFVQKIFGAFNIILPRSTREQIHLGVVVANTMDFSKIKPGDLLFFKKERSHVVGHTGIYVGDGKMIHSSSMKSKDVQISDLTLDYFKNNFLVAKRIFEVSKEVLH